MPYVITTTHTALYLQLPDFVHGETAWTNDIEQAQKFYEPPEILLSAMRADYQMREGTLFAAWIDDIYPNKIFHEPKKADLI